MAQGYTAMVARLHELIQGAAGASRPLDAGETERVFYAPDLEPESVAPSYSLWPLSETGATDVAASDVISGTLIMRTAGFRLTLSQFCGGGEGGTSNEPAVALALMGRWAAIVWLLGDPNNRAYSTSGIIHCRAFEAGEPSKPDPAQRRMELTGTFSVLYDSAVAAM